MGGPKRVALTLLETIVALVLMASVLVSSLLALSSHRRQMRVADKRLEAAAVADQLYDQLRRDGKSAVMKSGSVAGRPGWFWNTRVVGTAVLASEPVSVIRLTIQEMSAVPVELISVEYVVARVASP